MVPQHAVRIVIRSIQGQIVVLGIAFTNLTVTGNA
jgi:hypothetical protein